MDPISQPPQGITPPPLNVLPGPPLLDFFGTPAPLVISAPRPLPARTTWGGTLVLACLAIGILAAVSQYERDQLFAERQRAANLYTEAALAEGRDADLGKFLADPSTRLIALAGTQFYSVQRGAIAWNPQQHRAAFLVDRLPALDANLQYEIWGGSAADEWTRLGAVDAQAGVSAYWVQFAPPAAPVAHLEVTAGPRTADKVPLLAGNVD